MGAPPWTCMMVAPAGGLSRSLRFLSLASLGDSPRRPARFSAQVRGGGGVVRPRGGGGPEFGRAAAGGDLGEGRSAGDGGPRAAAIWSAGRLCLRMSLIWLRVRPAGCVSGRRGSFRRAGGRSRRSGPRRRSGRRSLGARGRLGGAADLLLAVGEGVEEREADRVRFGAGGDLASPPGWGCELAVGVVPELAGLVVRI